MRTKRRYPALQKNSHRRQLLQNRGGYVIIWDEGGQRRNVRLLNLGCDDLSESELYKELGALTQAKGQWKENIPYVSSLLNHESEKIQAKALWMLGEMGLVYPLSVQGTVPVIASFCDSPVPLLRERAVNALGRIGRGSFQVIGPYWKNLFRFAEDEDAKVRLSFIWASENIATNSPDLYEHYMPVFEKLLHDSDDKVRTQ